MKTEMEGPDKEVRESWIAVGADGAEHLFVRCSRCGHPQEQTRILRITDEDHKKLEAQDDLVDQSASRGPKMMFIIFLTFLFAVVWQIFSSIPEFPVWSFIGDSFVLAVLFWAILQRHYTGLQKRTAMREKILARYGAKIEDH